MKISVTFDVSKETLSILAESFGEKNWTRQDFREWAQLAISSDIENLETAEEESNE